MTSTNAVEDEQSPDAILRGFVGYKLRRAYGAIRADLLAVLKQFDLRMGTYSALTVIVERPGLYQSQLADALQIEQTNVVAIVDALERRKLVKRERAKADRRAYALNPTPLGIELRNAAFAADRTHEERILAGLSDVEISRLSETLRKIERAATSEAMPSAPENSRPAAALHRATGYPRGRKREEHNAE